MVAWLLNAAGLGTAGNEKGGSNWESIRYSAPNFPPWGWAVNGIAGITVAGVAIAGLPNCLASTASTRYSIKWLPQHWCRRSWTRKYWLRADPGSNCGDLICFLLLRPRLLEQVLKLH